MAALHTALQSLSPTAFSSVPASQSETTAYLEQAFRDARTVIDSVPLPAPSDEVSANRPRSDTGTSVASNISEISSSSARSELLDPANEILQKEWGKPLKVSPKENQLGISVYKLGGKDGRGNWFARRSVHEGLGFKRWKMAMEREFPETLQVQGGPGEGNIRGIGGERKVEQQKIDGVGNVEVYHLSAQFPGPTTPRDFVTLLLTSSTALTPTLASGEPPSEDSRLSGAPRHYMVISRPCDHPECPPRDGFVRGQYESVEFIREIPRPKPRKSLSSSDLRKYMKHNAGSPSMEREAIMRSAMQKTQNSADSLPNDDQILSNSSEGALKDGRQRGRTISFAGSRGQSAKGEKVDTPSMDDEDEDNPVEWIMVTRSDPGGGIPRFMVDRGTPGSICVDAGKFLNWAIKKEHSEEDIANLEPSDSGPNKAQKQEELEAYQTNGHLAGLEETPLAQPANAKELQPAVSDAATPAESGGLFSTVAHAAYAGIEAYAPQAVINRLPGHEQSMSTSMASSQESAAPDAVQSLTRRVSSSSISSVGSFASAEDHFEDSLSLKSADSQKKSSSVGAEAAMTAHEKELAKLNERKKRLTERLAKAREKEIKDKQELSSKEEERIRKAEEKHAQEIAKQEDRYRKEIAKLDAKRQKEAAKVEERKRRTEEKDEKNRLIRERDEARQSLEMMTKERDLLRDQVGALQRENTSLVAKIGKWNEGQEVLKEIKAEVGAGGNRSRSGSMRRGKEKGAEATVLGGGEKALKENVNVNMSENAEK